jgi:hypothetical protein
VVAGIGDDLFAPPDAEPVARMIESGGELPESAFLGPSERLLAGLPDAELKVLRGVDHSRTPSAMGFLDAALRFIDA